MEKRREREQQQGSPALMDDMMFTAPGAAKRLLPDPEDENDRPSLGNLETLDAILRNAAHAILTPSSGDDPEVHTRNIIEATAWILLGRGNEHRVTEGWNTPDAGGRVGLAESLRKKFALDPAPPEAIVAGVLSVMMAEVFSLTNDQQKGENVEGALDGLFQTYSWLFIGIDPATIE